MRKFIRTLFVLINLLCIACALVTFGGSVLSPERWVAPAYFALVFPVTLFINAGFVVLWLALRKWYFLLSLALLVGFYPCIKTVFPTHIQPPAQESSDSTFTLMSYNTWMFGRMKKHTSQSPNPVVSHILEADPDIVCLQELAVANNYMTHDDVLRIFRKYPYKHIYYKSRRTHRRLGVGTFSKYPIVRKATVDIPAEQNAAIYSDIVVRGDTIRLFNCHLESNRLTEKDKSMPAELRKNFDAEHLSDVAQHLSRKLGTAYRTRAAQADTVAAYTSRSPHRTVVCGDLNDVPLSYAYTTVRGNMRDAFEELGFGLGFTFHEGMYKFRIDYVLCHPDITPLHLRRDKVPHSDHYPLTCTLRVE